MSTNDSCEKRECFITHQQFNSFKERVQIQFENLRNIMDLQQKQINLLTNSAHLKEQQSNANLGKNKEIQEENRQLKLKIEQLESAILLLHKQKNGFENVKQMSTFQSSAKINECFNSQESLSKLSLSSESQLSSQDDKSVKDDSSKYLMDIRKTKENEEGLEEEDDDLIECVWEDSFRQDGKVDILNNEKHRHNPHNKEFSIENKDDCLTITKCTGNTFFSPAHTFIYKDPILPQTTSKFTIKKIKIRDIFLIGIASVYVFGVENAFRHKEMVAYSSNGDLWLEGDSRRVGRELKLGESIEMMMDRKGRAVSWFINDILMGRAEIPHHMRDKQLYLAVMMFNKDDKVQLHHYK